MSAAFGALAAAGRSAIEFVDAAGDASRPITLHCYRATTHEPGSPVVFVQHGMGRNGDEYRDFWIEAADRHGLLIVAPTFSAAAYPGAELYNNGHVLDHDGALRPVSQRGYKVPARVFALLRGRGSRRGRRRICSGIQRGGSSCIG